MRGTKITLAEVFASQLRADPEMARHVKDFIPPKTLLYLLGIKMEPGTTLTIIKPNLRVMDLGTHHQITVDGEPYTKEVTLITSNAQSTQNGNGS